MKTYGRHVILECWTSIGNPTLTTVEIIQSALENAAKVVGATVLGSNFHHFGDGFGVTGVVMLSESHMSIHTWPEDGYCAIDVFMCGECDPRNSVGPIIKDLGIQMYKVNVIKRG
jgi:S-adenosylmethionine decarboxylase